MVQRIFDLAGFKVSRNIRLAGFEVDVHARYKDLEIIAECKQYESSSLNLPNLIFTWVGKNKKIGASKVLLVIYGQKVSGEHYRLAREENISIWTEDELNKFLDLSIEKGLDASLDILENLNLDVNEISERKREREVDWKPNVQLIKERYQGIYNMNRSETPWFFVEFLYGDEAQAVDLVDRIVDRFPSRTSIFEKQESAKRNLLSDSALRCDHIQKIVVEINDNKYAPVDTIVFPNFDIGAEEIELAEKYGIKCLVGRKEKTVKKGFLGPSILISASLNTDIIILTENDLSNLH